jgi:hypothetical protein
MKKYYEKQDGYDFQILVAGSKEAASFCEDRGYRRISYKEAWKNKKDFYCGLETITPIFSEDATDFYKRLMPIAIEATERLAEAERVSREWYESNLV